MFSHALGTNLELRLHEERFADEMYKVCDANRDHLRPFMPWIDNVKGVEDTRQFIRDSLTGFANNTRLNTGIWENGRIVGAVGFHNICARRRYAEMGYWLASDVQGRGIMTRACSAMITHAFDGLKLHRVEIRCDPDNAPSRAVARRLGFREEGVLKESLERFDKVMCDAVVYGMLTHEWKPGSAKV